MSRSFISSVIKILTVTFFLYILPPRWQYSTAVSFFRDLDKFYLTFLPQPKYHSNSMAAQGIFAGVRLGKRARGQPEGGWRPFGYFSSEGKVPRRRQPWGIGAHSPRWKDPGPGGGAPAALPPARWQAHLSCIGWMHPPSRRRGAHSPQREEKRGLFSPLFPLSQ